MIRFRQNFTGFTLVELMVTVAVIAVILVIGVPGIANMKRSGDLTTTSKELVVALNYARAEAVRQGASVQVGAIGTWGGGWNAGTNLDAADSDATLDVYLRNIVGDDTELISRADGAAGDKGNKASQNPSLSADGNRVAFISAAHNLDPAMTTPGNTNFAYVRDLNTNTTRLQSRADGGSGAIANDGVRSITMSAGGVAIGFASKSTNLDPGDTDTITDAYIRNSGSGDTVLASLAPTGTPVNANGESRDPSVSADGRYVAFTSSGMT